MMFSIIRSILLLCLVSAVIDARVFAADSPPEWLQGKVWYRILPERFRNINPQNDPIKTRVVSKELDDWQVHPWASDWYKLQIWEQVRNAPFREVVLDRRYGGDLIGVIEKLPYLKDLGVDIVYLTPVFESPSVEKYDASTLHHVDNNFGFAREADWKINRTEMENPASWTLSKADEVFIELINQAHELDMKVVIEASFSYCGAEFWAFRDLKENQEDSKYVEWFDVRSWDNAMTPDTSEFDYACWQDDRNRPTFKRDANGMLVEPVRKYIFDVTSRWMDPNADGDPSDGVDGWFVNHVEDLPGQFWREWNELVKSSNGNAITLADRSLEQHGFDLWIDHDYTQLLLDFFVSKTDVMTVSEFSEKLKQNFDRHSDELNRSLIRQLDDHHSYRIASTIVNARPPVANGASAINGYLRYNPGKPDSSHRKIQKLITLFQLTYPGSPMIFYGNESGMWGGDYPDNIKPMLWREFIYERETYTSLYPDLKTVSENALDQEMFDLHRRLNHVRLENPALTVGDYEEHIVDDERRVLVFSREHKDNEVWVFFNLSDEAQHIEIRPGWKKNREVMDPITQTKYKLDIFDIDLELEPMSGRVLVKD